MAVPCYIALLHHPMMNRRNEPVTTSVTNMDLHDISRSARTYGIRKYFVVTPIDEQHELVGRILGYWSSDGAREAHPDRVEAISRVQLAWNFQEVRDAVKQDCGEDPEVVMTDARRLPESVSYRDLRSELTDGSRKRPLLIVFGTGWGISEVFYPEVDRFLDPLFGPEGESGYNHLSVRAAVAGILDRLFGT